MLRADHTDVGHGSLVEYAEMGEIAPVITGVEIEDEQAAARADYGVATELA